MKTAKKDTAWYFPDTEVLAVKDGDTLRVRVTVDVGFNFEARHEFNVRLNGIDASDAEPGEGIAKQYLIDLLAAEGNRVLLVSVKGQRKDKYGRYLAGLRSMRDGRCLNQVMVDAGQAVHYEGSKRRA